MLRDYVSYGFHWEDVVRYLWDCHTDTRICGCDEYEYTIRMEPDGGVINRQIVCSENTPDDVRARLSELYDRQLDPNTFQGSFGETLPKDVGGFGKYVHLDNQMWRVYVYVERLRGQDTQALEIEEAFSNADRLVDLLTEWLQTELGEHPNFEKPRVFCDEALREDLKNLSLYSWVGGRASGEPDEAREQSGDPDFILDPCDVPRMMEDVTDKFSSMFFVNLFGSSGDKINVKLACPGEPYETNGQWDEKSGQLSWSDQVRADELPFLCYAIIGLANDTFQEGRFGKVVLQDDQLVEYSFWHKGLSPEQRTERDQRVTS